MTPAPGDTRRRAARPRRQRTGEVRASSLAAEERRAWRRVAASVVAAFLILLVLLAAIERLVPSGDARAHRRSSYSARADGYRGLLEVLRTLGFRVERHHRSYGRLPDPEGSLLLIIDPLPTLILSSRLSLHAGTAQARALDGWIRRGGHALLVPKGRSASDILAGGSVTGIDAVDAKLHEDIMTGLLEEAGVAEPRVEWGPAGGPVTGAGELEGFSDRWRSLPSADQQLLAASVRLPDAVGRALGTSDGDRDDGRTYIELFHEGGEAGTSPAASPAPVLRLGARPLAVSFPRGDGRVWLLSSAYPCANLPLASCGTARAVVALVDAASDGGRRAVVFDEYCHGFWERQGFAGWARRSGLLYPIAGVIVLVVLLYWRGAVRFGPAASLETARRRSKEEYVIGLADIAHRARRHRLAARWLVDLHRARIAAVAAPPAAGSGPAESGVPEIDRIARRVAASPVFGESDLRTAAREAAEIRRRIAQRNAPRGSNEGHRTS